MDRRHLRLVDTSDELLGEVWGELQRELLFTHSLLASVSLPYRSPGDARTFSRTSGRVSLRLDAGALPVGDGSWREVGLPYGAKARLLLLHLTSEAIRQRSPTVEVQDSFTAFARSLNISTDSRNLRLLREQVDRMAVVRMALALRDGESVEIFQSPIFEGIAGHFPDDPQQLPLWTSSVHFSEKFFQNAQKHAVPLNRRAVMALKHSARALDIYGWLAHRFFRLRQPVKIRWTSLRFQFGSPEQSIKTFKRKFSEALKQVLIVYPGARVESVYGGIRLLPSPTPVKARNLRAHGLLDG
jgi:hypothetical protein